MANKNITFDPNAGVAYGANLTINTGATFHETFKYFRSSGGTQITRHAFLTPIARGKYCAARVFGR